MQPAAEASSQPSVLTVRGLSKTYVTFKKAPGLWGGIKALVHREKVLVPAVKELDFSIARGEFVGLLGPNGAGKTTTLKMLTGLIRPSAGRAEAFQAFDTARRPSAYLRRIGMVMGQRNQLNPDLPAMDSFRLAQAIYGLDEGAFGRRIDECVELFAIRDKLLTPVRKLSLGERMKMELILAILHEPELLFLDEPTIGLDFNAARQIRAFLAEANRRLGITVVLTSHYTKDIEELCRRVVLINHGRIVYDGALSGMDERLQGQKTVALVLSDAAALGEARAALARLSADPALGVAPHPPRADAGDETGVPLALEMRFDVAPRHAAAVVTRLTVAVGEARVADVKIAERPLDEIFSEIYRQAADGGGK
jgi:ABC-2 type transport system ATP-binding protein